MKGNIYPIIIKKYSHFVLLAVLQMIAPGFTSNCGGLGNMRVATEYRHLVPPGRATPTHRAF